MGILTQLFRNNDAIFDVLSNRLFSETLVNEHTNREQLYVHIRIKILISVLDLS